MAAKYMGAKMLKKQIEKEQAKAAAHKRSKATVHQNKGEYLDRKKQRFDITQSSMAVDGDFAEEEEKDSENPKYEEAFEQLVRNDEFFLTMKEKYIEDDGDDDSDPEQMHIEEMIHRANTQTKTLFKGVASSAGITSQLSMQDSFHSGDDNTHRALLSNRDEMPDADAGSPSAKTGGDLDKDVAKIKDKIAGNLARSQDLIRPRRFIIKSSTSEYLGYFEYLVMTLAIWNALWTPLTIAFDQAKVLGEGTAFFIIDLFVDTVFVADIVLGFTQSYVDVANGDEIFAPKKIASHYVFKGSFLIDFMSTFPFTQIGTAAGLVSPNYFLFADMMSLLKAFRLKKILKKIRDLPINVEDKALMQVMYYAFLIFVYTHIIGCIMWLSLKTDERWIPAVSFGALDVRVHRDYRFYTDGEIYQLTANDVLMYEWFTAWYNSAISFALVEVNARTADQITMMFCIYCINAMINAYLIGVFIEQFSVKNEKKNMKQEELDDSNQTMSNLKIIPEVLKLQVRTYFLQSFQMKMLQTEFEEIDKDLPASLQQRMKFEIAERIISDSRSLLYLRLFMIQDYSKRREHLMNTNPTSPLLKKLDPISMANEYKKMMFMLINNLYMAHHKPGERVITQNEPVLDEETQMKEDACVYFIMTGNYKVLSLMFEMRHKRKDMKDRSAEIDTTTPKSKKGLRTGDFFGEVSLLFGCRRTATVKAKQYCECAYLKKDDFNQLLANHKVMKTYFIKNIQKNYDDELKIFLLTVLQKIDYLQGEGITEEVMTHIAMHMVANQADKDTNLYQANNAFTNRYVDQMIIIYDGQLAIQQEVDGATEMNIEYITKGTILNSHNFLSQRPTAVTVKCLTAVTYYYLPFDILLDISRIYPALKTALNTAQHTARRNNLLYMNLIDYTETNFVLEKKYPLAVENKVKMTEDQKKRLPIMRLQLKNAVMHYLNQIRKQNKQNSLSQILANAVREVKNRKKKQETMNKEMQQMGLVMRLNTLDVNGSRLTDQQFEILESKGNNLSSSTLIKMQYSINSLKDRLAGQFLPTLEEKFEANSELDLEEQDEN